MKLNIKKILTASFTAFLLGLGTTANAGEISHNFDKNTATVSNKTVKIQGIKNKLSIVDQIDWNKEIDLEDDLQNLVNTRNYNKIMGIKDTGNLNKDIHKKLKKLLMIIAYLQTGYSNDQNLNDIINGNIKRIMNKLGKLGLGENTPEENKTNSEVVNNLFNAIEKLGAIQNQGDQAVNEEAREVLKRGISEVMITPGG